MLPIPKIFDKINHQPKESPLYLALMVGPKKVKSCIWVFEEGQGKIVSFGSLEKWSGDSPEELVVSADTSIASAVSKLSEISNQQPNMVVLGLPENWTEGNGVKDAQSKILQIICRKLLLRSQGFIVNQDAITHFLKNKEGELVSLILVNLEESEIVVSLIVQGKLLGSQTVSRSNSLALDLEEGLIRFNYTNPLPPRIMLIDGENLEEAKQTLVAYPWVSPENQGKISFLQLPRVDFAPENLEIEAVVFAGSLEIFPQKDKKVSLPVIEQEIETEIQPTQDFSLPEEDFGFVKNKDIFLDQSLPIKPAIPFQEIEPTISEPEKKTGFKIDKLRSLVKKLFIFDKILKVVKKIPQKIPKKFPLMKINWPKKGLLFLVLGFALILGVFLFSYLQIVKAEVNLLVQPTVVEKQIEFIVSDKIIEPDLKKKVLPLEKLTTEVSGSKSAMVQGRKTVGDKASGEVLVYNGTDKKKIFPKQTIVFGPEGLKFVMQEELSVPARTTDINSSPPVDKWGEGKVAVMAEEIGTQYNLASGSNLSLDSKTGTASSFLVRNPSGFSGGSSREISAVSKQDQNNLIEMILSELEIQAEEELAAKVPETSFLPDSFKLVSQTEKFSHEVGDETNELSLEERAVYSISYFKQEALTALIEQETASLVPEGYNPTPFKQDKQFNLQDKVKNQYLALVSTQYFPNISLTEIASGLKGKLVSQSKKILGKTERVSGYEIKITPRIFSVLPLLPLRSKNIIVKMTSI